MDGEEPTQGTWGYRRTHLKIPRFSPLAAALADTQTQRPKMSSILDV